MQRALRRSVSAVGPLKDPRGMRNSPRSLAIVRLHYRIHIGARDAAALCCLRSLGAGSRIVCNRDSRIWRLSQGSDTMQI